MGWEKLVCLLAFQKTRESVVFTMIWRDGRRSLELGWREARWGGEEMTKVERGGKKSSLLWIIFIFRFELSLFFVVCLALALCFHILVLLAAAIHMWTFKVARGGWDRNFQRIFVAFCWFRFFMIDINLQWTVAKSSWIRRNPPSHSFFAREREKPLCSKLTATFNFPLLNIHHATYIHSSSKTFSSEFI